MVNITNPSVVVSPPMGDSVVVVVRPFSPSLLPRFSTPSNILEAVSIALSRAANVSSLVSVVSSSSSDDEIGDGVTVVASSALAVVVDRKTVMGRLKESTLWNCCCCCCPSPVRCVETGLALHKRNAMATCKEARTSARPGTAELRGGLFLLRVLLPASIRRTSKEEEEAGFLWHITEYGF